MAVCITFRIILFSILLVDLLIISVKGENSESEKVVTPGKVVRDKLQPVDSFTKRFSLLQAKLENIADNLNFFQADESTKADIQKKLLQKPDLQAIIEECNKYRKPIICHESPYQSVDGSCNNLNHPSWGQSFTQQQRFFPPNYEGSNGLRKSKNGEKLPNARRISLSTSRISNPSQTVSALFTFFGQYLAHDISGTPEVISINGETVPCCEITNTVEENSFCADSEISSTDPFYAQYNVTCQPIHRAAPYPTCNISKRQIINEKTSFIDVSGTYDNTQQHFKHLRANDGTGRLRTQDSNYGELLPENDGNMAFCPVNETEKCFEGGDIRTNQHTMLISVVTMFVRLHNYIADALHKLNPNWDEDKIFFEARRIHIALTQYITYEEYLPYLIGFENMENYLLYPDFENGSLYDDGLDPSLFVEFSTAAFRAHSMVPTDFSSSTARCQFRDTYSNTRHIHSGHLDSLLAGTSELPSENNDEFQNEDMSEFLYKGPGATYGFDIYQIDIQRGRDVGLPTYTDVVHFCSKGLKIQDFSNLNDSGLMTQENAEELANIYNDVSDIDLYVGILREKREGEAALGPTASCIATKQFHRLKFGDSFFFTHTNGRNPFTRKQLQTIRTYSLARIICETLEVEKIRKSPLLLPSENNPLVSCNTFSPMDLTAWKELSS